MKKTICRWKLDPEGNVVDDLSKPIIEVEVDDTGRVTSSLKGVDLTRANLTGANMAGMDLTGTNFTWAILTGADFTGADLTDENFEGSILIRANLTGTGLTPEILRKHHVIFNETTIFDEAQK